VRGHCAQSLSRALVPVRVFRVAEMPRNVGDKIDRNQLIKLANMM